MAARTGHEAEDRQEGQKRAQGRRGEFVEAFGQIESSHFRDNKFIPLTVTFSPPDNRWYDALNCHYRLKALLDGMADEFMVNDGRFWPVTLEIAPSVRNGMVVFEFGK